MNDTTKGEPLTVKTFKYVLTHLKNKNKKMYRHINRSGEQFQHPRCHVYIHGGLHGQRNGARHI